MLVEATRVKTVERANQDLPKNGIDVFAKQVGWVISAVHMVGTKHSSYAFI